MWTEYQNDDTVLQRIWPLTSAVAERLWSPAELLSAEKAGPRLEEQRCRMAMRGVQVGVASGPGNCHFHNLSSLAWQAAAHPARVLQSQQQQQQQHQLEAHRVVAEAAPLPSFYLLLLLLMLLVTLCLAVAALLRRGSPSHWLADKRAPLLGRLLWSLSPRRLLTLLLTLTVLYVVTWLAPYIFVLKSGGPRHLHSNRVSFKMEELDQTKSLNY